MGYRSIAALLLEVWRGAAAERVCFTGAGSLSITYLFYICFTVVSIESMACLPSMPAPCSHPPAAGSIEVQHEQGLLRVDGWARFKAPARIAGKCWGGRQHQRKGCNCFRHALIDWLSVLTLYVEWHWWLSRSKHKDSTDPCPSPLAQQN